MSEMDNSLLQNCREIINKLLIINFKQRFLVIIFDELFDPDL